MIQYNPESTMEALVQRSNRLGADRSICNWGGGNTSMKTVSTDFRGNKIEVLWVKGSGSDLAEATANNFTALRLEDLLPLMERDEMSDEDMVDYISHCMLNHKHSRASIETLLHAFLPFAHVDHTHPDSIISICCTEGGRQIAESLFGERMVWVPYIRPGFKLSKMIAQEVMENRRCELVLMEKHGLITWGKTSEECCQNTLRVVEEAKRFIDERVQEEALFGGQKYPRVPEAERIQVALQVLPVIRGIISERHSMLLAYDASADFLQFVNSENASFLCQVGAACPDHLVHTKRVPLYVDWDPASHDVQDLVDKVRTGLEEYRREYESYFHKNSSGVETMGDPYPRMILIPGVGVIGTGKSKKYADIAVSLNRRAVAVMRGATTLGRFVSLSETESFGIEYWPLEQYKLTLVPKERDLSGQVALITGGAGGIGRATCERLVAEGATVVVADLEYEAAKQFADGLNAAHKESQALAVRMNVTVEEDVARAFAETVLKFGGLDILVSNAGLASSAPIADTPLSEWDRNLSVLGTGYFLVSRQAFRLFQKQGIGGNVVYVTSKNAVYAGKDASAYSSAKALEAHLARCLAVEGGPHGIRVNAVLPDAVLQGSSIWSSSWREQRARAYGIHADELEDYYRKRTLLGVNVVPGDIAEVIVFFASTRSAKTTGCMITVDGGVAGAFVR